VAPGVSLESTVRREELLLAVAVNVPQQGAPLDERADSSLIDLLRPARSLGSVASIDSHFIAVGHRYLNLSVIVQVCGHQILGVAHSQAA